MTIIQIKPSPKKASGPLLEHAKTGNKRTGFKRIRQKQVSAQDDNQPSPRFPKAMNDLNWRQKSSDSSSRPQSTSSENEHPVPCRLPVSTKTRVIRNVRKETKDFNMMNPQITLKIDREMNGDENTSAHPNTQYKLVKHINCHTKSALDTSLHVIEVAPTDDFSSDQRGIQSSDSSLDIRPLNMEIAAKGILTPSNSKQPDIRHSDSMDASDVFYKVPPNSSENLLLPENDHRLRGESMTNWPHLSQVQAHEASPYHPTDSLVTHIIPQGLLSSRQSREAAFKKLIQKLQVNIRTDVGSSEPRTPRDSGYSSTIGRKDGEQLAPNKAVARKPLGGSGRRVATMSDNRVDYGFRNIASYTESGDNDTDTEGDHAVKFNTLNPRAREFLSFTNSQPLSNTDSTIDEQDDGSNMLPTRKPPMDETLPAFALPPPSRFDPTSTDRGLSPMPFMNVGTKVDKEALPSQSIQLPKLGNTVMQPLPFSLPGVAHVVVPTANGLQLLPLTYLPTLTPNTSAMMIQPPLNANIANSFTKISSTATTPPAAAPAPASAPTPATAPAFPSTTRPHPVAKPKVPNAMGQQAYEAWIEWRKANEPGYAQECKMRQQRRSQRGKINHGTKNSVATAA